MRRIHVWAVRLPEWEPWESLVAPVLDREERARADRFRFAADRRRYTLCRGILRMLLGAWTGEPAERLRFAMNRYGKPALPDGPSFNLSHGGTLALVAIRASGPVGVDVEGLRDLGDEERLASRFFAPAEAAALAAAEPGAYLREFFRCWTRKEAVLKAAGTGLHAPLDSFSVAAERPRAGACSWKEVLDYGGQSLDLREIRLDGEHAGAVAAPRLPWTLEAERLEPPALRGVAVPPPDWMIESREAPARRKDGVTTWR